jgi:hypothetical protein
MVKDPGKLRRTNAATRATQLRELVEPWFHHVDGRAAARVADATLALASDGPPARRSLALAMRGARHASPQRLLAGAATTLVGSRCAGRLQAIARPARQAKGFGRRDVEVRLKRLAAVDDAPCRFHVRHTRHPLTGMPLASVRIVAA